MFYYILATLCIVMTVAAWKFIGMQVRDLKVAMITLLVAFAFTSAGVNYMFYSGVFKASEPVKYAKVMRQGNVDLSAADVFAELPKELP